MLILSNSEEGLGSAFSKVCSRKLKMLWFLRIISSYLGGDTDFFKRFRITIGISQKDKMFNFTGSLENHYGIFLYLQ